MKTFDQLLSSSREVSVQEFYDSDVAKQNGVDSSWFISFQPTSFVVFDGDSWMVRFDRPGEPSIYWALVETEERYGDLSELARWVYDWLYEECDE